MEENEIKLNPSFITIGECSEGKHVATAQFVNDKLCVVIHEQTEHGLLSEDSFVAAIPMETVLNFWEENKNSIVDEISE
jgi:hypothetical protein